MTIRKLQKIMLLFIILYSSLIVIGCSHAPKQPIDVIIKEKMTYLGNALSSAQDEKIVTKLYNSTVDFIASNVGVSVLLTLVALQFTDNIPTLAASHMVLMSVYEKAGEIKRARYHKAKAKKISPNTVSQLKKAYISYLSPDPVYTDPKSNLIKERLKQLEELGIE